MKNNTDFVKGSAITSLIFSAGIGIGLYFLKQYHTDKVDQARIEGIEDFISSGSAAKYANGEMPEGEFPLCDMSSKQDWEVIVRYRPDKKSAKPSMKSSQKANIRELLKEDLDHLRELFANTSQDGERPADPKE